LLARYAFFIYLTKATHMKKILKLSLAAVAIATLAACGGGSDSTAHVFNIDSYVGTWKSPCYSYVATNGSSYYSIRTKTLAKVSATELSNVTKAENSYSDAACTNLVANFVTNYNLGKYVFDGKTAVFAGMTVDTMVHTDLVNGEVLSGYMLADGKQLYVATYATGQAISSWGIYSPYTKQ
jgi:hypothetical protein